MSEVGEEQNQSCRFYQQCGPSALNDFPLLQSRQWGGPKFRVRYCFGDPSHCPFFQVRLEQERSKNPAGK